MTEARAPHRNPLPQLVPQRVRRARARVGAALWSGWRELPVEGGPLNDPPRPLAEARGQPMRPVIPGERFGPPHGGWQQRWFRVRLPGDAAGAHLHWLCDGEATVWLDERPWAGLDFAHRTCPVPPGARELWLDCGTYQTGIADAQCPRIGPDGLRFDAARLAVRDPAAWRALGELDVLAPLVAQLLEDGGHEISDRRYGHQAPLERASPLLRQLLRALDDACDALDAEGVAAFADALERARARFPAETWQPIAAVCPQTHIDLVWLWPEAEAERKAVHSVATALRLLEAYPEARFTASQPAMYRALERRAPALMAEVRARIAEGRWEPVGGFEVEPDTQLPCGEALARSLVIGQRFLAELRGGQPNGVCWLPDVFGYSACLPQLLRLAGVRHFFTTKLRWSAITRFPWQSFVWRGHDGSEVLAQISPIGYTGVCEVGPLVGAAREHGQADVSPEMLLAQGLGDGGGGPTEAMYERARRLGDLAGVPRVRLSRAGDFFARLEGARDRLPVWQGELYLEYHRGTYTSQGELKRVYRAAERALQAHEAARALTGAGPIDEAAWRRLAFAQFHDALPGSSIGLVYRQLVPELRAVGDGALAAAHAELAAAGQGRGLVAWNPVALPRTVVVTPPEGAPVALALPPLGHVSVAEAPPADLAPAHATPRLLDNGVVRAELDDGGRLVALRVRGEALRLDGVAGLELGPDEPAMFDAWDIDHPAARPGRPVAPLRLAVHEQGPVRAVLRGEVALGAESRARVDYVLEAGSPWLRVELEVDWREAHRLLRFRAPTAYRGRWARFGAPFGSVQRPQQPAGPAEEAQWEVPGSRWAAVTDDDGAGLALVTEASYGFSCREGQLALSLLRGPRDPDPDADRGVHRIAFAIGRHEPRTDGRALSTAAAAEALFAPVLLVAAAHLPPAPFRLHGLGSLCPAWVVPNARGAFTVRLHETAGGRGEAALEARDGGRVALVDLLGDAFAEAAPGARGHVLPYAPYQVVSAAVRPR